MDRNHIGICGFSGMGLNVTADDKLIKAVTTTSIMICTAQWQKA